VTEKEVRACEIIIKKKKKKERKTKLKMSDNAGPRDIEQEGVVKKM
jgi:hypothetical protein